MFQMRFVLYIGALFLSGQIFADKEAIQTLNQELENTYASVFRDKILLARIQPSAWNDLVKKVGIVVKQTTSDGTLQSTYQKLAAISAEATSSITLIYNLAKANKDDFTPSDNTIAVMDKLGKSSENNKKIATALGDTVYFWGSKREVQQLLLKLSSMLQKIMSETVTMYRISDFVYKKSKK